MTHWAMDYIGKPWVVASDGPEAYDCWGLIVAIHKRLYGRALEIIPVEENNLRQLIKTINASPERANWDVVHNPIEGDIALMRQSRHPILLVFGSILMVEACSIPCKALVSSSKI